jgi:hypothetical protein
MVKVLVMMTVGLAVLTRVAAAEVAAARIFHSCDDPGGCQVRQADIYEKSDVDAKIGEVRGAVTALEGRLLELSRRVDAQERVIEALKKKLDQR